LSRRGIRKPDENATKGGRPAVGEGKKGVKKTERPSAYSGKSKRKKSHSQRVGVNVGAQGTSWETEEKGAELKGAETGPLGKAPGDL